jgi:hypothetical protein
MKEHVEGQERTPHVRLMPELVQSQVEGPAGQAQLASNSGASPKVSRLVPRIASLQETESRLRTCLPKVPVTRLSDLTPLDRLRLPVYCAVTPLARDLTTHLGKGLSAEAARVSALMEAVERASAEQLVRGNHRGTFQALQHAGLPVVDPRSFDLPADSSFTPDQEVTWVEGVELSSGSEAWLPIDLAITPPTEREHDVFLGEAPAEVKAHAARWQLATGRYRRYAAALLADLGLLEGSPDAVYRLLVRRGLTAEDERDRWMLAHQLERKSLERSAARTDSLASLPRLLEDRETEILDALWGELAVSGELEPAVLQWRAVRDAARESRSRKWTPNDVHYFVAESELAYSHGFPCWQELERNLTAHERMWTWVKDCRQALAHAKRFKDSLFSGGASSLDT